MRKKLNISYGMSNETKVSVGEFEVDVYDEIENSLENIIQAITPRISLTKLKKLNITIEEISSEAA